MEIRRLEESRSLSGKVLANTADRFRRNPEVRGDHPLGNTEHDGRIRLYEIQVALFCRSAEGIDDAPVFGGSVFLESRLEAGGIAGNLFEKFLVRRWIEQEQLGIFDRVNEVLRRRSRHQTCAVRQPP